MTLPVALAGVSAGLSIFGGLSGNAAIRKAAAAQYSSNKLFIERDQAVANSQNKFMAQEINSQIGMQLSDLHFQAVKAMGALETNRIERNVYGNTALRERVAMDMQEELKGDTIRQAAEAKMVEVNNRYLDIKYQTEAKHVENLQAYNNAMSQQQSGMSILAGGISAGISGYNAGLNMESAASNLSLLKNPPTSAASNAYRNVAQNGGQLGVRPIG